MDDNRVKFDSQSIAEFVHQTDSDFSPTAHNQCASAETQWPDIVLALPEVDEKLDPFSQAWTDWQIGLYEIVSGTKYNPEETEQFVEFDVDDHLAAPNAFRHKDPTVAGEHLALLARIVRASGLKTTGAQWVEMGSGWGFCSEALATLGYKVSGVDINPRFATLSNARAQRLGLQNLTYEVGSFDQHHYCRNVNAILFYECLHHSPNPALTLEIASSALPVGGFLVTAAEPFVDYWGEKGWGIRNDAPAVYCMHKYGWFESGWSVGYLAACFYRAGCVPVYFHDRQSALGNFMAGFKGNTIPNCLLREAVEPAGWFFETPDILVGRGNSSLSLFSDSTRTASLYVGNYSGGAMDVEVSVNSINTVETIATGESTLKITLSEGRNEIRFISDPWVPSKRFSSLDQRSISFHLYSVEMSENHSVPRPSAMEIR
jgi:SAM-dependent methyltransferase